VVVKNLREIPDIPFNPAVKAWKEQGKKVVGFLCSFVPEEIIYAADILPYRVRATGCNRTTQGDLWMSNFTCSFARSCLEFAMDGSYDFLDGLVGLDSCAMIHKLYDNWRIITNPSFSHFLTVPHKNGDSAILWYRDEIEALKQAVQEHFGTEIRRESLEKAIEIYNETRRLLRELYELRKSQALPITGSETQSLVLAAMSMPREQYNEILRRR
jgi:benzoyl-CoA reductase/2-hydroxyglutaryl-CoA dehydratase subunit BcrC/BadD/HgdB